MDGRDTAAFHGPRYTVFFLAILLFTVTVVPVASAIPATVTGLNAIVMDSGATQQVRFKFPVAETGVQYNLTLDAGSPVDQGNVTQFNDYIESGGYVSFTVLIGGPTDSYDAWVHGFDGVDEGPDSCIVTFNTSFEHTYDSCGSMQLAYSNQFCLDATIENFGFGDYERVTANSDETGLRFRAIAGASAWGGINLGGDTTEQRFNYSISANSDAAKSKILFFWSEVGVDVSHISVADGESTILSDFNFPNEGAFSDGFGIIFIEDGADYEYKSYYNTGGSTFIVDEQQWSQGIDSETPTYGGFTISTVTDTFNATLGGESATYSLTQELRAPNNFNSLWIMEIGASFTFLGATSNHLTDQDSGCVKTIDANLGGGTALVGDPGTQTLEDFEGQGGLGGSPEFPGVDVETTATAWGMESIFFSYILAGILFMAFCIAGWFLGGGPGVLVGGGLSIMTATFLNLIPYWMLILVLLLAVTIVVQSFRGRPA